MVKIENQIVNDLPASIMKKLSRLCLKNGTMYPQLKYLRGIKSKDSLCFLAYLDDLLVGWGLVFPNHCEGNMDFNINIYVHPKYRRKKIGSLIYSNANQFCIKSKKVLWATAHDETSNSFYKSVEINTKNIFQYWNIK